MLGESGFVIEDKVLVVSGKDMILFETLDEADVEHNSSGVGDTKLKSCTALSCTTSPGSRKGLTGAFHANNEFLENSSPHESPAIGSNERMGLGDPHPRTSMGSENM